MGLAANGVEVSAADAVVGTSAGSVVGFTLAAGRDLTQATDLVTKANDGDSLVGDADVAAAQGAQDLEALLSTVAEAAANPDAAEGIRARLGTMALAAATVSEERWLEGFAEFAGAEWPDGFACTAVDVTTGRFKVWDKDSGVEVQHAVASSCAVPCLFPPVTIAGERWMDGGVRDMVNADVVTGHDAVLVISCTLLELPEGLALPTLDAVFAATRAQLDALREGGSKVETVVPGPEMLEVSGWGMNLMDFTLTGAAYEAGVRQGESEAARLAGFWAG